jgi:hypothetical protein
MRIADGKAVLYKSPYSSCFVRLFANGRWKQWGSAQLPLNATSGTWQYRPPPNNDVLLLDPSGNDWVLLFQDMPPDFFKQLCVKALTGDGLVNVINPNQIPDTIRYTFWQGCPSQDAAGAPDDDGDA